VAQTKTASCGIARYTGRGAAPPPRQRHTYAPGPRWRALVKLPPLQLVLQVDGYAGYTSSPGRHGPAARHARLLLEPPRPSFYSSRRAATKPIATEALAPSTALRHRGSARGSPSSGSPGRCAGTREADLRCAEAVAEAKPAKCRGLKLGERAATALNNWDGLVPPRRRPHRDRFDTVERPRSVARAQANTQECPGSPATISSRELGDDRFADRDLQAELSRSARVG